MCIQRQTGETQRRRGLMGCCEGLLLSQLNIVEQMVFLSCINRRQYGQKRCFFIMMVQKFLGGFFSFQIRMSVYIYACVCVCSSRRDIALQYSDYSSPPHGSCILKSACKEKNQRESKFPLKIFQDFHTGILYPIWENFPLSSFMHKIQLLICIQGVG